MGITKTDLENYRNIDKKGYNIFNIGILHEIMSNDDVDHIEDERLLGVANVVYQCWLKDDDNFTLSQIVNAVLLNYKDIKEQDLSPREILARFI